MSGKTEEFRTKMKVSNPLNDIAANLGVTPKVLTQLAIGDDQEFRELVRGIFSILPEDEILLVAGDNSINAEFLEYLTHLFEKNQRVLMTILHNPSAQTQTRQFILEQLPDNVVRALASSPKTPPEVLQAISQSHNMSSDMLAMLLANAATPEELKERIIAESSEEVEDLSEDQLILEEEIPENPEQMIPSGADEIDAKIALCVDKLYEINADIVTEFIRKARAEILKRLNLMAKVNRVILKTIVRHPALTVDELERIDLEMFGSLLKQTSGEITDQMVFELLRQAEKKKPSLP